jgi:hypothetical protein
MKLRLQITVAGQTTVLEHAGPVIHLGRDPSCELALQGDASTGVSRRHARIELRPEGATLTDAGSSNGTLRNDKPVEGTVPLRVGDRIQLGYTGPTLSVLELDLKAPAPPPKAAAAAPIALIGVGAAVIATVLVLVGLGWAFLRPPRPAEPTTPEPFALGPTAPTPAQVPVAVSTRQEPLDTGKMPLGDTQKHTHPQTTNPDKTTAQERQLAEDTKEEPVGRYLADKGGAPSVLLARRGAAYPWAPLRPEANVMTAQTLLSLPGYHSEIVLDKGVQLTLWGNVPQFCGVPPLLLESMVMLHVPREGTDLDLTLEWGRIKLANRKDRGPAHVRLRVQREVWDLTLNDKDSEACAELWATLPPPGAANKGRDVTLACGVFTKGLVTLQRTGPHSQRQELRDVERVSWINVPGAPLFSEKMSRLPGWWAEPPDPKKDEIADVMLSLNDWAGKLNGTGRLVDTIQKAVGESSDPGFREQAMFLLAALDGAPYLASYLEDPKHERVRRAAAHALRCWLTHGHGRAAELPRLLQATVKEEEKANLILDLLHPYPEADVERPETYQKLIAHLDDDNLAVRELAYWQLEDLAPMEAKKLTYNPAEGRDERKQVVANWQKILPPGSLPQKPPRQ